MLAGRGDGAVAASVESAVFVGVIAHDSGAVRSAVNRSMAL